MFSDIPNPPPALQELRLKLREVLANIGYCMAAGMGTDEQVLRHDLSVKFPDEGTEARLAALAAAQAGRGSRCCIKQPLVIVNTSTNGSIAEELS